MTAYVVLLLEGSEVSNRDYFPENWKSLNLNYKFAWNDNYGDRRTKDDWHNVSNIANDPLYTMSPNSKEYQKAAMFRL